MSNRMLSWPVGKETQCVAYLAACDIQWQASFGDPELGYGDIGVFSYNYPVVDIFGQMGCPFYGPPFEFPENTLVVETPELALLRADAVLTDNALQLPED